MARRRTRSRRRTRLGAIPGRYGFDDGAPESTGKRVGKFALKAAIGYFVVAPLVVIGVGAGLFYFLNRQGADATLPPLPPAPDQTFRLTLGPNPP